MSNLYTEKSIESLDPRSFTRLKPFVYCGDTTYSTQLLIEGFSNCVDEANLGHGNIIKVNINKDIITLEDEGQGFIVNSIREDGKTILEAAFSVLNTSGKYRNDGTYEGTSLGAFGIGSKLICFLSKYLKVTTYRDNKYETIIFKDGLFQSREVGDEIRHSGTVLKWLPDEQFFTHTEVEIDKIKTLFQTVSCLCKGLTIELNDNGNKFIYQSNNGLNDLVDFAVKDKEIIKNRFECNYQENKAKLNLVMTYTNNYSSTIVPYVNTGLTESGPHITQIKTAITREFNKFFKDKKWIKEKEDGLSGDDIQEGLYIVFNMTVPSVKYDAQIKSRITGIECKELINRFTLELREWLNYNEKEIKGIADKAITARKAREAAKKAREATRNIKTKKEGLKAKMELSDKLIPCTSKDVSKNNLLIVEGTK